MNFSFEGNYKPRRNINLGGVKSVDDKRSLLAKAQAERRAREQDRLKLKSAQRLQVMNVNDAHYRSTTYWDKKLRLFIEDVSKLLSFDNNCV